MENVLSFIWLSGGQTPDHNTVNCFRRSHLKATVHDIFTQTATMLVDMGYLSPDVIYTDGTKRTASFMEKNRSSDKPNRTKATTASATLTKRIPIK